MAGAAFHRQVREDFTDLVYLTKDEKFEAILEDIRDCRVRGQPALVGTASIDTSEYLSNLLKKANIKHEVLNAKQHEQEGEIIKNAGQKGAVTIATNMAGRGTDIILGGNINFKIQKKLYDIIFEADTRAGKIFDIALIFLIVFKPLSPGRYQSVIMISKVLLLLIIFKASSLLLAVKTSISQDNSISLRIS